MRIQAQTAAAMHVRKPSPGMESSLLVRDKLASNTKIEPQNNGHFRMLPVTSAVNSTKLTSELFAESVVNSVADTVSTASVPFKELLSEKDTQKDEVIRFAAKGDCRIATVQLISGESIENVSFCARDKARLICEGLGFEGIVLENDDGRICVVRESNIKMVTWNRSLDNSDGH